MNLVEKKHLPKIRNESNGLVGWDACVEQQDTI